MKHIKCKECNVKLTTDNWYPSRKKHGIKVCIPCYSTLYKYVKRNSDRMFVNSKYIPQTHPLHKPGRYKTFEGAAFSSLEGYEKSTEGHVYIISNPCWDGWIKVGMAVDAEDRCNQYQTSSPHRDYKLCYTRYFEDRTIAEQMAHKKLKKISTKHKGEWFKVSTKEATNLIQAI